MRAAVALFALALALAGCSSSYYVDIDFETPSQPIVTSSDTGAYAIAQGTANAFIAYESIEDSEGSSTQGIPVVTSDDPSIVRVEPAARWYSLSNSSVSEKAFVMIGVAPGHTRLHLSRSGGELGTIDIEVVAQDP